jgi:hypothetical protein
MRAHAQAISEFRKIFESCLAEFGQQCDNGFTWPPLPAFHRSQRGILMEVAFSNGKIRIIPCLYTPFGQVKVLGYSKTAKALFNRIAKIAELVDVSDTVGFHSLNLYGNHFVCCGWGAKKESSPGAGDQVKIYWLKFRSHYDFAAAVNAVDTFHTFSVNRSGDMSMVDEKLFSLVTDGKNAF